MLNRLSAWLLVGALGLMPLLLLATFSGGSKAYYAIMLACVMIVATMPRDRLALLSPYRAVLIAFTLPLLAALASVALTGSWADNSFERGLRLAVGAPLLLTALLYLGHTRLRPALWGLALAGWAATLNVLRLIYPDLSERPVTEHYNAVGYGNLMLLMATLTLFSLPIRMTRYPRAEVIVKLLTVAVTFAGFILTQTRTGWMALPIFIGLALILFGRLRHPLRLAGALVGILVVLVALGSLSPTLRDRFELGLNQSGECLEHTQADTSVCVRVQLWRASIDMALEQPLTGVGSGRAFERTLRQYHEEGRVSEYVAHNFGEPHNDLLEALAVHGIPGAIALLLLYFVPAATFLRRLGDDLPPGVRAAAAMGAATCLGFAAFGLTEFMFRGMRTLGFYVVLVMLFLTLSDIRLADRRKKPRPPA